MRRHVGARHRSDVGIVAANGDGQVGHPDAASVGRIERHDARMPRAVRHQDLDPGMGSTGAEQLTGDVAGGQPQATGDGQQDVREVLADAGALGERLGGRGANGGDVVRVLHELIDALACRERKLAALETGVAQVPDQCVEVPVGSGQRCGVEKTAVVEQCARGEMVVVRPTLDHARGEEGHLLGDVWDLDVDHVVAETVRRGADVLGGGVDHLHSARDPPLVAVVLTRLHHQALAESMHRALVLVRDPLLDHVGASPHPRPVNRRGVEAGRVDGLLEAVELIAERQPHEASSNSPRTGGYALDHGVAATGSATTRIAASGARP